MSRERHPKSTIWADEALFTRLLDEARTVVDRTTLDIAVLHAVQKTCVAMQVTVAWFLSHDPDEPVFLRGARLDGVGAAPQPIPAAPGLPASMRTPTIPRGLGRGAARHVAALEDGIDLRLRWVDDDVTVELRCHARALADLPRSSAEDRRTAIVAELGRSSRVLSEVVQLLRPMHRFAQEGALSETRREVETWITDTRTFELHDQPDPTDRARAATRLVDHARILLLRPETSSFDRQRIRTAVERVVRSIVHSVMSSGWRTHGRAGLARRPRESKRLGELVAKLDALPSHTVMAPGGRMSVSARIHLLRSILDAAATAGPSDAARVEAILDRADRPHLDDQELRLFAAWAIVHDLAHTQLVRRSSTAADADTAWAHALDCTRAWLPRVLAAWTEPTPRTAYAGRDPFHIGAVRNWLFLWFVHHVLPTTPPPALTKDVWRTRRALAHVLRETLRAKLYSSSPGYTRHSALFTDALQLLVDQHVVLDAELALPHNTRGHLALIGDDKHPRGARFSDGHLHHVLELYVAGHFMLSCTVEGLPTPFRRVPTTAEALAHPHGGHIDARRTRDLLAAWSLAALYHDVGLSLFPEFRPARDPVTRLHPSASKGIESVRTALEDGGRALAKRARDALVEAEVFDPDREAPLTDWIDAQIEAGRPNHALTGAWYLHCASALIPGLRASIRHEAVRAVLLHAAPTHIIDPTKDPVAALLALCDELFEWDPSDPPLRQPGHTGPGRSSRTASIEFTQLKVHASDHGVLHTAFHPAHDPVTTAADGPPSWPRIKLTHVHPEKLGNQVFPMWLSIAQNVCRIQPGAHGFAPVIDLHGPVPRLVQRTTESTHSLLGAILDQPSPWSPPIAFWYRATLSIPVSEVETDDTGRPVLETRRVFPIGRAITDDDIRTRIADLRNAARKYLLEYESWT